MNYLRNLILLYNAFKNVSLLHFFFSPLCLHTFLLIFMSFFMFHFIIVVSVFLLHSYLRSILRGAYKFYFHVQHLRNNPCTFYHNLSITHAL